VRYAYAQATGQDILNGTAASQYHTVHAAERFTAAQGAAPLLPGDLLAYGTASNIHHVAIYLGAGKMVEARQSGTHIMVSDVRLAGDYFGAVRINGGPVTGATFQTWGTDVWTHATASTTSARVYAFPGPTTVHISCQKHAETVTAEGYTNDAWSYLPDYKAWVTNIYIQGPAWLDGVPTCA
jgi:cell wall-associated NlpC family hydrolase